MLEFENWVSACRKEGQNFETLTTVKKIEYKNGLGWIKSCNRDLGPNSPKVVEYVGGEGYAQFREIDPKDWDWDIKESLENYILLKKEEEDEESGLTVETEVEVFTETPRRDCFGTYINFNGTSERLFDCETNLFVAKRDGFNFEVVWIAPSVLNSLEAIGVDTEDCFDDVSDRDFRKRFRLPMTCGMSTLDLPYWHGPSLNESIDCPELVLITRDPKFGHDSASAYLAVTLMNMIPE